MARPPVLELSAAIADRTPTPDSGGGSRALEVRLARSWSEVDAAMALRYRVFFDPMSGGNQPDRRDEDPFDPLCDHLLAIDHATGAVVGTYRLLRRSVAIRRDGFYSAGEFDLGPLLAQPGELLELGRSCIDPAYRTGAVMALLWQGIARYVFTHEVTLMFGCASLPGSDPTLLAGTLAYLHANHLAPPELRASAVRARRVEMRPDRDSPPPARVMLPPLVKGYLRLGGFVGDGAVVDCAFNTTDVCVVVKTSLMTQRYYRHYARQAWPAA
jgi:L-ornithine Nalpha-acyltransferase